MNILQCTVCSKDCIECTACNFLHQTFPMRSFFGARCKRQKNAAIIKIDQSSMFTKNYLHCPLVDDCVHFKMWK